MHEPRGPRRRAPQRGPLAPQSWKCSALSWRVQGSTCYATISLLYPRFSPLSSPSPAQFFTYRQDKRGLGLKRIRVAGLMSLSLVKDPPVLSLETLPAPNLVPHLANSSSAYSEVKFVKCRTLLTSTDFPITLFMEEQENRHLMCNSQENLLSNLGTNQATLPSRQTSKVNRTSKWYKQHENQTKQNETQ